MALPDTKAGVKVCLPVSRQAEQGMTHPMPVPQGDVQVGLGWCAPAWTAKSSILLPLCACRGRDGSSVWTAKPCEILLSL